MNRKIGILTLPFGANYGNLLQQFALIKFLKLKGYNAISLNRKWNNPNRDSLLYKAKKYAYYNILCKNIYRFYRSYVIPQTKEILSDEEMFNFDFSNYDAMIVGSDQVWRISNTRGVGFNYFLDFISSASVKKISYGASLGVDYWEGTDNEAKTVSRLLKDFTLITTREESGVDICRDLFQLDGVKCVLDPTLLLSQENYISLFETSYNKDSFPTAFLASYILDDTQDKKTLVKNISNADKLKLKSLFNQNKYSVYMPVEKWLASIFYSKYVITDSYHGMIFSIIFNKQFVVLGNPKRGLTRFESLLNILGLQDRLVLKNTDVESIREKLHRTIDYGLVKNRLIKARQESENILLTAL